MEPIVLIGFLESNNGHSCELHPFGCWNSLVLNRDDWGVGLHLCLCMTKAANKLACYIIRSNGADGCHVGFTVREYAAGDNGPWLDGAIIEIVTIHTQQQEPHSGSTLATFSFINVMKSVDSSLVS
jgi:hypothetical protein